MSDLVPVCAVCASPLAETALESVPNYGAIGRGCAVCMPILRDALIPPHRTTVNEDFSGF